MKAKYYLVTRSRYRSPNGMRSRRRSIQLQNQFDKAKINENIVKSIVTGVNTLCSILFFDMAFPNVFNKKSPVISHNAYVIIFLGISMDITSACTKITITNIRLMMIEKISKRYISLSDFNLPPQIRW